MGFGLADGLFSAEEDFEFVAFDIDLDKTDILEVVAIESGNGNFDVNEALSFGRDLGFEGCPA